MLRIVNWLGGHIAICVLLLINPLDGNAEETRIQGVATVVDGDTLRLGAVTIRIHGIDAPEANQNCASSDGLSWPCGNIATSQLADRAEGRDITCRPIDRDAYGRIVAKCAVDNSDLALDLVSKGLAWAFLRYSDDYASAENIARKAGLGVWQADNQPPWEFRANRWQRAATAAPREGCPIKGNISHRGEKIYHTPWSPAYGRTIINEAKGERWFCDEAEATAAGWRAARFR